MYVACSFLLLACTDRVGGRFASYEDAERADAINRGVVPAFIPRTAVEIWEEHDLDTNQQWLRFNVPAGDTAFLAAGQAMTATQARSVYQQPPSGLSEMPPGFRGSDVPDTLAGRMRFVSFPPERAWGFCVAFDRTAHLAYVWTCDRTA
jgi:hypothetical protein